MEHFLILYSQNNVSSSLWSKIKFYLYFFFQVNWFYFLFTFKEFKWYQRVYIEKGNLPQAQDLQFSKPSILLKISHVYTSRHLHTCIFLPFVSKWKHTMDMKLDIAFSNLNFFCQLSTTLNINSMQDDSDVETIRQEM